LIAAGPRTTVPATMPKDPMRRAFQLALAAAATAAAAACAPNPIIARDPIPPPTPAHAYACDSYTFTGGQFYHSACVPVPPRQAVVVRAKG
jgi:hypothetical protein